MSMPFGFSMREKTKESSVLHCSPYIQEWMVRGSGRKRKGERTGADFNSEPLSLGRWSGDEE